MNRVKVGGRGNPLRKCVSQEFHEILHRSDEQLLDRHPPEAPPAGPLVPITFGRGEPAFHQVLPRLVIPPGLRALRILASRFDEFLVGIPLDGPPPLSLVHRSRSGHARHAFFEALYSTHFRFGRTTASTRDVPPDKCTYPARGRIENPLCRTDRYPSSSRPGSSDASRSRLILAPRSFRWSRTWCPLRPPPRLRPPCPHASGSGLPAHGPRWLPRW